MKWTDEKINKLIDLYPINTNKELANIFGVTEQSVSTKGKLLKLFKLKEFNSYKNRIKWTNEKNNELLKLYPLYTNREIAILFNTTVKAISNQSKKLGISKPENFKFKNTKETIWSEVMVKKLIQFYPNNKNEDLAKMLNTTKKSIASKSSKLNLHKSKEFKSSLTAKRNKIIGRDLNLKTLKAIAKKFKTRGEFQKKDPSAYTSARASGVLNEVCKHMIKQNYSIPQLILSYIIKIIINEDILYNTRNIISPFEIDVYIDKYKLAFEYDGKGWHKNKRRDKDKDKLCKDKNIKLIRIVENNRNYVTDIKNQLIYNLPNINKYINKTITINDIINIKEHDINNYVNKNILDDKTIISTISKYNNYHDFITNERFLYEKLRRNKCIEKYTSHLKKTKIFWTEALIIIEVGKYKRLCDFIKKSYGCYLHINKNKLNHYLKFLTRGKK